MFLQSLLDTCRGLDPVNPDLPVIVPGPRSVDSNIIFSLSDSLFLIRGRNRESDVDRRGGVTYKEEQIKNMLELASELNVTPPAVRSRLVN